MTIVYKPDKLLRKIAPAKKIERLVSGNLTLNKAVLSMFNDIPFISKGTIKDAALSTIKQYKKKYADLKKEGEAAAIAKEETLNDKVLLVDRVQSAVIFEVSSEIKDQYLGEYYTWLPSSATEPDPEHQLKYGKRYQIGKGEQPGERWGCKCGMEILVPEKTLDL
jgi:hypothetical protein